MILLVGITGSGKSMQGRLLAEEKGFAWLSVGELVRILVTGERRREMLQGKLLSDEEMINILDKIFDLMNLKEEIVLEGFPRTAGQTEWLLKQIKSSRLKIEAVFNLVITTDAVRQRLETRGRIDDTSDAINRRFEEYNRITHPVIDLLKAQGLPVYDIDANQTPQAIHQSIWGYVKSLDIVTNDNKG
jgi:adenylate kinase